MIRIDEVGLNVIRRVTDLWNASQSKSLAEYTAMTRIEPITLIDTDLIHYENTELILKTLVNIFAGYYLQAWTLSTGLGVNSVEIRRSLDRMNPNRSAIKSGVDTAGWVMSAESYNHRLPGPRIMPSFEAIDVKFPNVELDPEYQAPNVGVHRDTVSTLKDLVSLAVGKELVLEIQDGDCKAQITANVRLMTTNIPTEEMVRLLSHSGQPRGYIERYNAWRMGRLEFIKDICLAQDLIREHRKNLVKDKTGIIQKILSRRRSNKLASVFSGNPSIATASNLAVITADTARAIEGELSGKLDDFKTREKVFDDSYLMIMVVVDKDWDRVTLYTQGLAESQDISIREMKGSSKNGPDVAEILRAFRAGSTPGL